MRVHASGVGKTVEEALAKPLAELATAALHAHELDRLEDKFKNVGGKPVLDPQKGRIPNPHRALLENTLRSLIATVEPVEGYQYRAIVNCSDDGSDSHVRVEVDLVRG